MQLIQPQLQAWIVSFEKTNNIQYVANVHVFLHITWEISACWGCGSCEGKRKTENTKSKHFADLIQQIFPHYNSTPCTLISVLYSPMLCVHWWIKHTVTCIVVSNYTYSTFPWSASRELLSYFKICSTKGQWKIYNNDSRSEFNINSISKDCKVILSTGKSKLGEF